MPENKHRTLLYSLTHRQLSATSLLCVLVKNAYICLDNVQLSDILETLLRLSPSFELRNFEPSGDRKAIRNALVIMEYLLSSRDLILTRRGFPCSLSVLMVGMRRPE